MQDVGLYNLTEQNFTKSRHFSLGRFHPLATRFETDVEFWTYKIKKNQNAPIFNLQFNAISNAR
jgi:hypothetical protein